MDFVFTKPVSLKLSVKSSRWIHVHVMSIHEKEQACSPVLSGWMYFLNVCLDIFCYLCRFWLLPISQTPMHCSRMSSHHLVHCLLPALLVTTCTIGSWEPQRLVSFCLFYDSYIVQKFLSCWLITLFANSGHLGSHEGILWWFPQCTSWTHLFIPCHLSQWRVDDSSR